MQFPIQITFRHATPTAAIEADIRDKIAKLAHMYDQITSCHVVVEEPHHHQHKGRIYQVHLNIIVPKGEIIVSHNAEHDLAHEDVYVAIRDAFDAAKRQLQEHFQKLRHS